MTKTIRRLQRIGSSILVCLPKEWVEQNTLDKKSEVQVEYNAHGITITPNKIGRVPKEIDIVYPLPKEENATATITGAYLLGYDVISIKSKSRILNDDREQIRKSMRKLVGMEIIEEDSKKITIQFLLDTTTLSPEKILKRISSLVFGMFDDVLQGMISFDMATMQELSNRDNEVNRQYFLLVRLLRSMMIDKHLANTFNLENIDSLDYRLAANLLENAGDTVVDLGNIIYSTKLPKNDLKTISSLLDGFEIVQENSILSFIQNDRSMAIQVINIHKQYQKKIIKFRQQLEKRKNVPVTSLELLYMVERITKSWSDIVDLVKPFYK